MVPEVTYDTAALLAVINIYADSFGFKAQDLLFDLAEVHR